MILGKVTSRVVSTAKLDNVPRRQLLSIEPLPGFGDPVVAVDTVSAGPGDLVLVMQEGSGARQALGTEDPLPLQMVVIAVVDSVQT